jgi:hypothetical protein
VVTSILWCLIVNLHIGTQRTHTTGHGNRWRTSTRKWTQASWTTSTLRDLRSKMWIPNNRSIGTGPQLLPCSTPSPPQQSPHRWHSGYWLSFLQVCPKPLHYILSIDISSTHGLSKNIITWYTHSTRTHITYIHWLNINQPTHKCKPFTRTMQHTCCACTSIKLSAKVLQRGLFLIRAQWSFLCRSLILKTGWNSLDLFLRCNFFLKRTVGFKIGIDLWIHHPNLTSSLFQANLANSFSMLI